MPDRTPPTAAQALYGHLPSAGPEPPQRREPNSIADALYPALSREAKAQDADRERRKQSTLRHLRELNAAIDRRLAREKR
jgi:hypothetical protein